MRPAGRYDGEEGTLSHMRRSSETMSDPISLATPLSAQGGFFPQATPTESPSNIPMPHSDVSATEADRKRVETRLKVRV